MTDQIPESKKPNQLSEIYKTISTVLSYSLAFIYVIISFSFIRYSFFGGLIMLFSAIAILPIIQKLVFEKNKINFGGLGVSWITCAIIVFFIGSGIASSTSEYNEAIKKQNEVKTANVETITDKNKEAQPPASQEIKKEEPKLIEVEKTPIEKLKAEHSKFDFRVSDNNVSSTIKLSSTRDVNYKQFVSSFGIISKKAFDYGFEEFSLSGVVDAIDLKGNDKDAKGNPLTGQAWYISCTKKFCNDITWSSFDATSIFDRFKKLQIASQDLTSEKYIAPEFIYIINQNLSSIKESDNVWFNSGLGVIK